MSEKFIVTADWHAHCWRDGVPVGGINSRLLDFCNALRELTGYARDQKIKRVYMLGDVWHLKKNIPEQARNQVFMYLWHARDLEWTFVAGNHDREDDRYDSVTSLPLKSFCEVYAEPVERDRITFIPWLYDQERVRKALKTLGKKSDILMFHGELDGAEVGPTDYELKSKVTEALIKPAQYAHVFAGHIHKRQKTKGVWYPGSLIAKDYGEQELDKGFLVVDGTKVKVVPVSYPKFINLKLTEQECRHVEQYSEVLKGNHVRIIVPKSLDPAVVKVLEQANPRSLDIRPQQETPTIAGHAVETRTLKDLIKLYVEIKGIPVELSEEYIAYANEILAS